MSRRRRKRRLTASAFIGLGGSNSAAGKLRLQERDERMRLDTRSEAERWLGDPPPWRSALARSGFEGGSKPTSASGTRVDLWKFK
jgi:hypothetical protein